MKKIISPLCSKVEVCKILNISESTLMSMVHQDMFPAPLRIGLEPKSAKCQWRRAEVFHWIESQTGISNVKLPWLHNKKAKKA